MNEEESVVAIVATTQAAGKRYARSLELGGGFKVVTDMRHIQGLRFKAVIITPAYLLWSLQGLDQRLNNFYEASNAAGALNAEMG